MSTFEDRLKNPATTYRSMLSASSRKKRDAIVALELCISHGALPKKLRVRAENSIKAMLLDLRFRRAELSPEQQERNESGQSRADKIEVMNVLNEALAGPIPKWTRHRIERSVRDMRFNITMTQNRKLPSV